MLTLLNACSTTSSNEEFAKLSRQEQLAQLNNINELEENGKIALISRYKKQDLPLTAPITTKELLLIRVYWSHGYAVCHVRGLC